MRELMYKAKRLKSREWKEGNLFLDLEGGNMILVDNHELDWLRCVFMRKVDAIDTTTICTYTGLRDKNGNKIFTQDDVSYYGDHGEEYSGCVAYGEYTDIAQNTKKGFYIVWRKKNDGSTPGIIQDLVFMADKVKVTGSLCDIIDKLNEINEELGGGE